jgi:hypothetical protein
MMPIINIHPLPSEEKAESFRLSLKDADKFGLYCCHDGTSAMWSVIPKIALQLIFNAETALPVTERTWVGLTDEEIKAFDTWHDNREEGVGWVNPSEIVAYIEAKLKDKNT